jgi:two-component system sensor kinase FixL
MREHDLPTADRQVLLSLQIRSLASVTLLALLGAATMVSFSVQTREMETAASVLNLSGRQRMLSQRAALLAAELERASETGVTDKLRGELLEVGAQIESSHGSLASGELLGLEDGLPAAVHAVYFEPPHVLDQQVRDFVVTLRAAADPSLDPVFSSVGLRSLVGIGLEERILPSLEAATTELERHTTEKIARLRWTTRLMAALTLVTLWFLGQFVLRPMMRGLRQHLSSLRRGELEVQATIEDSPIGLATFDGAGRMLSANRALCKMLGRERSELLRRSLETVLHPEDFERHHAGFSALLDGGLDHLALDSRFLRRDGEIRYGQLHCGVLQISAGDPRRLIIHFVDRTEQKIARQEARQNQERLAHLTRLTTIGEMAAGLAHEINQPLTAISTYAEASRRLIQSNRADSSELLEVLDKVSGQAHRAGSVIQRLRLFIKKRHSRDELADVNRIVAEAIELARTEARFRDVPLHLRLEPSLARVVVDSVQIEQVILNLVRNAVEASLAADRPEPVSIQTRSCDDVFVEVSITDRGVGLNEDEQARLFEAFYSTKPSGLGMGLNLSRSIIDSFGGRLWCESNPGQGATFRFTLPVAVGEETRPESRAVATT